MTAMGRDATVADRLSSVAANVSDGGIAAVRVMTCLHRTAPRRGMTDLARLGAPRGVSLACTCTPVRRSNDDGFPIPDRRRAWPVGARRFWRRAGRFGPVDRAVPVARHCTGFAQRY